MKLDPKANKNCKQCSGTGLKMVCDFNFNVQHIPCDCLKVNNV